ncbi:HEAT repeat domain-containing protein, partial [bacterium]|nr:HEAT repeat domain-containing protein [bacterium]
IRLDKLDMLTSISDTICSIDDENLLNKLLDYLKSKLNEGAIENLITLMGRLNGEYSEAISDFLKEKNLINEYCKYIDAFDPIVRVGAIRLIRNSKNFVNYDRIMKRVDDPDKTVRIEVLTALHMINPSKAYGVIKNYVRDSDNDVVINAIKILREYKNKSDDLCQLFVDLLIHPSECVKKIAAEEVAKNYFMMMSTIGRADERMVSKILNSVVEINVDSFSFVSGNMLSNSLEIRLNTIKFLKLFVNNKLFYLYEEQLLRALKDPIMEIVKASIGIFAAIKDPAEFVSIVELLRAPSRFDIFDEIIMCAINLKKSIGKRFIEWIVDYYQANVNDIHVKAYLLIILIQLGKSAAFKELIAMILSDSYIERSSSIEAFGFIAKGDKVKIIFSALQDSSPEVRLSSLKVLKRMKIQGRQIMNNLKYIRPLLSDKDVRIQKYSQEILTEIK